MASNPQQKLKNLFSEKINISSRRRNYCSLQWKWYSRFKVCFKLTETNTSTWGPAPKKGGQYENWEGEKEAKMVWRLWLDYYIQRWETVELDNYFNEHQMENYTDTGTKNKRNFSGLRHI